MRKERWDMMIQELQGHPSRCKTSDDAEFPKGFLDLLSDASRKNINVLMLGCGDGKEVRMMKDMGFKNVLGVTLGDINVEAGIEDYDLSPSELVTGDFHDLSFIDKQTIDLIYCDQVFEHAYAPMFMVMEMWRLLTSIGVWYMRFPSHKSHGKSKLTDPMTAELSHHHPNMIRHDEARLLFQKLGFNIEYEVLGQNSEFLVKKVPLGFLESVGVHGSVANAYREILKRNG